MFINQIFKSLKDSCRVCGQTPCNCTHIAESVAEGTGNIGPSIKTLFQKIYDQGDDEIEYFYYESPVFAQYWDKYEGDIDSIVAEVDPKELQIIHDELEAYVEGAGLEEEKIKGVDGKACWKGKRYAGKVKKADGTYKDKCVPMEQGVAEADKLKGTPVVSLSDFGDKDNTKERYGRTVPKKLKKDDPRVRFHKDYNQHEKKLIGKMSNAEKADKGWRNPNIDEQGVAEGMERLDPFTRTVINYMEDNSWLSAERAYFRAIGLEKKKQMNPHRWAEEVQYYIDRYNEYKGVAEVSDATLTSYLTKVDADSQKHDQDPTKRSAEKRNKSVAGFSRAFNKLDSRREKTDEVKQKAVPSNQRDPGALATRSHIASQEKAHSDWDQRQKKLSDEFYKNHPELDDRNKTMTKENGMADELARMAMKRNPKALVRRDGETLQSPPPGPKPAGTTAPRPAPKFDPEAEYSDDYSVWHRRTHGVKEDSAVDRLVKEFDEMLSARMKK